MNAGAKFAIATGVASGYLLGRTRKLKLAITVGSMLAGKRIATDRRGLVKQANELVQSNPELSELQEQVRTKLFEAGRAAAITAASNRMDNLSDLIRDRTEQLELPASERDGAESPRKTGGSANNTGGSAGKTGGSAKKSSGSTAKKTSGTAKRTSNATKKSSGSTKKPSGATTKKSSGAARKSSSSTSSNKRASSGSGSTRKR